MPLKLVILSPEKKILETLCRQVSIPTVEGRIAVLPRHIPLFTQMSAGEVLVKDESGQETSLAVSGGFANIRHAEVVLLAEFGVLSSEINEEQIRQAKARAEEVLKNLSDEKSQALAQADLARSVLQLKVVNRRHRHN